MSEIRDAILRQMFNLHVSIYQVSKLVEAEIPQRTVYAFLTGEKDAGTETASIIMKALGLTVELTEDKNLFLGNTKMKEQKVNTFLGRVKQEWVKAGKPKWNPRELLGICLLIDLEFETEGLNPAKKFRSAVESRNLSYLNMWAQGLKIASWK